MKSSIKKISIKRLIVKSGFIALVLAVLLTPANVRSQGEVTLSDIHKSVIENSFASSTAANQVAMAEQGFNLYKSQLKPGLNLTADIPNYSKTSAPVTQPDGSIAFQSIRQASSNVGLSASQVLSATGGTIFATTQLNRFDDYSNNFQQYNGIPIRVGIIQPILGFNPWKYRKTIEPLLMEEANRNYSIKLEEALTTATTLYFNVLAADQDLQIAKTNQSVNENLLSITIERLQLGKVSKDEKLQLEIELNQAKLSVSQASFQKQRAKAALYTYLGEKMPTDVTFATPSNNDVKEIDIAALMAAYTMHRPETVAYQRSIAQAESDIAESNALFGPSANLIASFGLARGSESLSEIYSDPFTEQSANLILSIPILDWGQRKSAVTQAKIKKLDVQASFEQQLLELENNIEQRAYRLLRLKNEIELLKEIMDKADERFNISNERYILGNIDITNLTLAQREKDQTKRDYVNALRTAWVTYYELRALTGYDIIAQEKIKY